jgi:hypothetical protein
VLVEIFRICHRRETKVDQVELFDAKVALV